MELTIINDSRPAPLLFKHEQSVHHKNIKPSDTLCKRSQRLHCCSDVLFCYEELRLLFCSQLKLRRKNSMLQFFKVWRNVTLPCLQSLTTNNIIFRISFNALRFKRCNILRCDFEEVSLIADIFYFHVVHTGALLDLLLIGNQQIVTMIRNFSELVNLAIKAIFDVVELIVQTFIFEELK